MHNQGLSNETLFGRLLRAFREAASLSQEELAERSQLSWRAITALERGERRRPRPRTVRMLANALNLPDQDRDRLFASVPGAEAGQHGGWSTLAPVVAQLPAAVVDFTCRGAEVDQLASRLRLAAAGPSATIVAAISGKPGIGKSTLAVHVAHLVRPDFPDGQLYADLGGPDALVESPADVLAGFLRALGVPPSAIPVAVPERAALYRSLLAGRRWLVLIDDARGEEQVRDLVPGAAGCAVLVTSRRRLTALAGADQCHLGDLDVDCGARLLGRIAGDGRIGSERWAAEAIVTRCGGLPLAIRVAGAVLRRKPHWPVARLAGREAAGTPEPAPGSAPDS